MDDSFRKLSLSWSIVPVRKCVRGQVLSDKFLKDGQIFFSSKQNSGFWIKLNIFCYRGDQKFKFLMNHFKRKWN